MSIIQLAQVGVLAIGLLGAVLSGSADDDSAAIFFASVGITSGVWALVTFLSQHLVWTT